MIMFNTENRHLGEVIILYLKRRKLILIVKFWIFEDEFCLSVLS